MMSWQHYCTGKIPTREAAIAEMHAFYNRYPGKRRKRSEDAFEVYRAKREPWGWILWVRRRKR